MITTSRVLSFVACGVLVSLPVIAGGCSNAGAPAPSATGQVSLVGSGASGTHTDPFAGRANVVREIGRWHASLRPGSATPLTFTPVLTPGSTPESFNNYAAGYLTFTTGTQGFGTNGCAMSNYCASVTLENDTPNTVVPNTTLNNVVIEITDYKNVTGATGGNTLFTDQVQASTTITNPYRSVLQNGGPAGGVSTASACTAGSGKYCGADVYGTMVAGSANAVAEIWAWSGLAATDGFDFDVRALASFPRSGTYTVSSTNGASLPTDACTSGTVLFSGTTTTGTQQLDFPFTLYDNTFDHIYVNADGYIIPYSGNTVPLGLSTVACPTLPISSTPILIPFMKSATQDSTFKACYQTSGTTPSRTTTISLDNYIVASGPDYMNFHVVLHEDSDEVDMYYGSPSSLTAYLNKFNLAVVGEINGTQNGMSANLALSGYTPCTTAASPFTGTYPVEVKFTPPSDP